MINTVNFCEILQFSVFNLQKCFCKNKYYIFVVFYLQNSVAIIKQSLVRKSARLLYFYLNNIVKYLTVLFCNILLLNHE